MEDTIATVQTEWQFSQADVEETERWPLQRLVERWDDLPTWLPVTALKTNRLRTVYRFDTASLLAAADASKGEVARGWVVKKYRSFGLFDRLRSSLIGTRAAREFSALSRLRGWGFAVPRPLAFGERTSPGGLSLEGGLVMEEIEAAVPVVTHLGQAFDQSKPNVPLVAEARERLVEIGRLVARLHDHGVVHPDLHGGNFLLGPDHDNGGARRLVLIDLHSCRFPGRVLRPARLGALAKIAHSLSWTVPREELRWLLAAYCVGAGVAGEGRREPLEAGSLEAAASSGSPFSAAMVNAAVARSVGQTEAAVAQRVESLERRRIASRTRRCLVNSTSFGVDRRRSTRVFHVRSWTADGAIALARPIPSGEVVKASLSGWVARLGVDSDGPGSKGRDTCTDVGGDVKRGLVVKYRRYSLGERLRGIFLRHRLLHSWVASHALRVRRVAAPAGFALVEKRSFGMVESAWLIQEAVPGGQPLDTFLWETFGPVGEARGAMARLKFSVSVAVGEALRRFHGVGACSHDCSPQNLVVVRGRLEGNAAEEGSHEASTWGSEELASMAASLETASVWLVDLDDVRFDRHRQSFASRIRNLVQAANLPEGHVSAMDRLRALRAYDHGSGDFWRKEVIGLLRRGLEEEALRTIQRMTRMEYEEWPSAVGQSDASP